LAILVAAVYHFNNYDGRRRHFSNVRSGNSWLQVGSILYYIITPIK
jgi:hypothetical protein